MLAIAIVYLRQYCLESVLGYRECRMQQKRRKRIIGAILHTLNE